MFPKSWALKRSINGKAAFDSVSNRSGAATSLVAKAHSVFAMAWGLKSSSTRGVASATASKIRMFDDPSLTAPHAQFANAARRTRHVGIDPFRGAFQHALDGLRVLHAALGQLVDGRRAPLSPIDSMWKSLVPSRCERRAAARRCAGS